MAKPRPADAHLESMTRKLQLLRDDVTSVALGYYTGMFVYGVGGLSKSWTICDQLRRMNVVVRRSTAHLTARALFEHLQQHFEAITLIEDNESLFRNMQAVSVLRAALWASPATDGSGDGRVADRLVTWGTGRGGHEEFMYAGGLIIVANSPPPPTPAVNALLTRIPVTHLQVSDAEMTAHMRHLAATAPPNIMGCKMSAEEALAVCEFVIDECAKRNHPLNLRLLYGAYSLYVQFENGDSGAHWQDRIRAVLDRRAPRFAHDVDVSGATGLDRMAQQRQIAREILDATNDRAEQLRMWRERTKFGVRTFDSRKSEIKAQGGAK